MVHSISGRRLRRRDFLQVGTTVLGLGLLSACATPAATPTKAPATAAATTAPKPAATQAPAATAAATQAPAVVTKAAGTPKQGGTFTMARTASVINFSPLNLVAGHFGFLRAMFNTLTRYDTNLKPQAELAESWSFSADGKQMTLKLRQGVKYHSGREFTSEDVKFSAEWGAANDQATMRTLYKTIKGVDTPDKYTAVLKFDTVNPGAFDVLDSLYMVDKETVNDFAKLAVGTGPFKFDKYIPNDRVEMVAFKDYWEKGKPYLERYIARQIPDLSTMSVNLESGAVDAIWQPAQVDLQRLKQSGKFQVDMGLLGSQMYSVMINTKKAPFTDKRVRQAIAWSMDRARYCKSVLLDLAEPTCLMWPKTSWAYFSDLEGKIGFNLDKAAALLKEAGVEKGFDVEILTCSKLQPPANAMALILQADLKKININARVVDQETAVFQNRITSTGDTEIVCHGYGRSSRDPGSLVTAAAMWYTNKQGGVCTHFESAEYDQLRVDLQSTLDQEKRKQLCRKIQELALDECFTIPSAPNARGFAVAPYVKGFGYDIDYAPFVGDFWLDK
ncbi:MAG: ABC transporter substrate-binding protein [Chloroflexota bacterium]